MTMKVTIRLFSVAKDLAGFEEKVILLNNSATTNSIKDYLVEINPEFSDWISVFRYAVNYEYVANDHKLKDRDEVAVIPPVSGG